MKTTKRFLMAAMIIALAVGINVHTAHAKTFYYSIGEGVYSNVNVEAGHENTDRYVTARFIPCEGAYWTDGSIMNYHNVSDKSAQIISQINNFDTYFDRSGSYENLEDIDIKLRHFDHSFSLYNGINLNILDGYRCVGIKLNGEFILPIDSDDIKVRFSGRYVYDLNGETVDMQHDGEWILTKSGDIIPDPIIIYNVKELVSSSPNKNVSLWWEDRALNGMGDLTFEAIIEKTNEPLTNERVFAGKFSFIDFLKWQNQIFDSGYDLSFITNSNVEGGTSDANNPDNGAAVNNLPGTDSDVVNSSNMANTSFTDVPADAYYNSAVSTAVARKITTGKTPTTFDPNGTCTRAEAVTFIYRAIGSPALTSAYMPFTDVPADAYFATPAAYAAQNGITSGKTATTFDPNGLCTRGEIVTFLYRALGSPSASGNIGSFGDVTANDFFATPVSWAVGNGVTMGKSAGAFSPYDVCTRAEIVTFLSRAYNW